MAEKQLHDLEYELDQAVAFMNENKLDMTGREIAEKRQEIIGLREEIQEILTSGAKSCPECGLHPLGINQPRYFFVGCMSDTCSERRSKGKTPGEAVANWNDEVYFERTGARLTTG